MGGVINYLLDPIETIIKESYEEASIPSELLVYPNFKMVSMINYQQLNNERGSIIDTEYIFDFLITNDEFVPKINDDEVESFELLSLNQVAELIKNDEFTPEAALVSIDFLIRFGFITVLNEELYEELIYILKSAKFNQFEIARPNWKK